MKKLEKMLSSSLSGAFGISWIMSFSTTEVTLRTWGISSDARSANTLHCFYSEALLHELLLALHGNLGEERGDQLG